MMREARRGASRPIFMTVALPFLLACLFVPAPARQDDDQDQPLRIHSDLVLVNVTVTDAEGKYSHGLRAADFQIFEDGQPQKVDSFLAEEAPFAAAILIDMSGSMGYKFGLVRAAAATFVEQIRDDDQVAVYGFNNKVHLLQEFSNLQQITDYVWDSKAENKTRLYDCINEAVDALAAREEKRRAILLISDGGDNASRSSYDAALKKALAAGVTVYSVDLIEDNTARGSAADMLLLRRGKKELQSFALETGGRYVASPTGDGLDESFSQIVEELRNQYTLSYYPTNQRRDGRWRKIEVRVGNGALKVRARRGYYAPKDGK